MSEKDMETNYNENDYAANENNFSSEAGTSDAAAASGDNAASMPFDNAEQAPVDYSSAAGQKEYIGAAGGYAGSYDGAAGTSDATGAGYDAQNVYNQTGEYNGSYTGATGTSDATGTGYDAQNAYNQAGGYAGSYDRAAGTSDAAGAGYDAQNVYNQTGGYTGNYTGATGDYTGGYAGGYTGNYAGAPGTGEQGKKKKEKKARKPMKPGTKKVIAVVVAVVLAFGAGFGGGALAINTLVGSGGSGSSGGTVKEKTVSVDSSETEMDAASAIAEKVMPSVVGISTVTQVYTQSMFGLQQGTAEGSGTGFIVDSNGYILTNAHVVEDSDSSQITVDLYDGTEKEGTVLWSDSSLDLAIVKIDATGLDAVEIGDSDDVKIGDYALAIGNPLGKDFERSVTQGIISGLNRSITTTDGSTTNNMEGLIQTDASINSGNSGGPLINSEGKVIGINTAKATSGEGLGFAIPINTAVPIINEIKEDGTYESAYIGIAGMDMATVKQYYETDAKAEEGVYVTQIYTGSPAATAGITEGDVIVEMNGESVDTMSTLKKLLVKCRPGDEVTLKIERDQKEQEVKVTLGKSSESTSGMKYKTQSSSGTTDDGSGSYSYGNDGSGNYNQNGGSSDGSSGSNDSSISEFFGGLFGN